MVCVEHDIIDETLRYFKANIFFKNYSIDGPADRVLVYLTLYVSQCLGELKKNPAKKDGTKALFTLSLKNFNIPGDANFELGGFFSAPESRADADEIRAYFVQLRQELGNRLVDLVYSGEGESLSKWWMCFSKRKFLNMKLS